MFDLNKSTGNGQNKKEGQNIGRLFLSVIKKEEKYSEVKKNF